MSKRVTALEIARKEVGTTEEGGGNNQKYGRWYRLNNQPWCAIFVSYVLFFSKVITNSQKCASVPIIYTWYKNNNKLTRSPKAGDLVFFDFNSDGIFEHIGFLNKDYMPYDDYFETIEGNTSPNSKGSQDNGDGVYIKQRHKSIKMAFAKPNYEE